jgi:DNA-binding transcriptional LysR family regulator
MRPFTPDQSALNRAPLDDETILSGQFWGELRVFLAVAKAKSFNRAAELLNTSQPTVSRQVKRLQDLMGSQLFVPTPSGVKLTQKGEALARALTDLDRSLYSISNDLRAETNEAEGVVRVTAFSAQVASHPAAAKELAHPVGVKASMRRPMVAQRPSRVRSAAFRSSALSFAKAFSIGLKSGE